MSKLLSKAEWDVLCFIEEQHFKKGEFPSLRNISLSTDVPQVEVSAALNSPLVQAALEARGIDWDPVTKKDQLSPQQIATIQMLLDISDNRSIKAKLASLGIKYAQLQGWKKQPEFMRAYRDASEKLYGEAIPDVNKAVIQAAVDGSYPHQKLMLAIAGRWDEKKSVEAMNVQFVLMKVLEIIQIHVSDPATLEAIASEFEVIINPKQKEITS